MFEWTRQPRRRHLRPAGEPHRPVHHPHRQRARTSTARGTRPPTTIDNGAYFWRVRARNYGGAVGAWSPLSTFYRGWPAPDAPPNHRITLLGAGRRGPARRASPSSGGAPVRLASSYQLQLGTDVNFSPGHLRHLHDAAHQLHPHRLVRPGPRQDLLLAGPRHRRSRRTSTGSTPSTFTLPVRPRASRSPCSPADGATGLVGAGEAARGLRSAPRGLNPTSSYKVTILKDNGAGGRDRRPPSRPATCPRTSTPPTGPSPGTCRSSRTRAPATSPAPASHFTSPSPPRPCSAPRPTRSPPNGTAGSHGAAPGVGAGGGRHAPTRSGAPPCPSTRVLPLQDRARGARLRPHRLVPAGQLHVLHPGQPQRRRLRRRRRRLLHRERAACDHAPGAGPLPARTRRAPSCRPRRRSSGRGTRRRRTT